MLLKSNKALASQTFAPSLKALEIPLRERNKLLNTAGFTNGYSESSLDAPIMESVKSLLEEMLEHHLPYPAYVLDRHWNITMQNSACDVFFTLIDTHNLSWASLPGSELSNAALFFVHPNGLRPYIRNFDEIVTLFMRRMKKEAIELQDETSFDLLESLFNHVDNIEASDMQPMLPALPVQIEFAETQLNLISVISSFGTAQDVTAQELRIETFYPADESSREFFRKL